MESKKKPPEKKSNDLQWAGIGVQMVLYIGIFVFAGIQLDAYMKTSKPWFTLSFSIVGVVFSMVYVIRNFLRNS